MDQPTLRSGRVIEKWFIAQASLRHNVNMVGDNIKFKFTDPPDPRFQPMSDIFNIPELLDLILQELTSAFLLRRVQRVCCGFKESIDTSPTSRKRTDFAIHVIDDYDSADGFPFSFNLIPRCLSVDGRGTDKYIIYCLFCQSRATFQRYRAREAQENALV